MSAGGAFTSIISLAGLTDRVPLVLLYQDLVGRAAEQTGIDGAQRFAGLIQKMETALARRAKRVAIVGEGFRPYFVEHGVNPDRIRRIRNPHRLEEPSESRLSVRQRLGWRDGEFVVLHTGNMGYKQGLENVVRAATIATGSPIRFVLQGDGSTRSDIQRLAARTPSCSLDFLPIASDEEFPNVVRAADALLLNQRPSVRNMSMPGKLGTYFAAGLPVIAAVAAGDETASEIRSVGGGIVVAPDDPAALVRAIIDLKEDSTRLRALGAAGRTFAELQLTESRFVSSIREILEEAMYCSDD